MRTHDCVTTEEIRIHVLPADTLVIPAGTFVKPIEFHYLPVHVKDNHKSINKLTEVICYTRYGMIRIDRSKIRRV